VFDSLADAVFVIDRSGHIIQANQAACRQLDYEIGELLGMTVSGISARKSFDPRKLAKTILARGEIVYESALRSRGGAVFPVEIKIRPLVHEEKDVFLAVARDISRRKQMEKAFEENSELHRMLVGTIPDIIIQTDADGTIVFANDVAVRFGGFAGVEDILGRNILSFAAPADREKAAASLKLMPNRNLEPTEYRMTFRPHEEFYFEVNGDVVRDARGTPCGMVFLIRDFTERKRAEMALQKRFAELQEALAQIKTLQGILPICSYCHRIRNDKEVWEQLEAYIGQHTDAQFSHGLCPECLQRHYPGICSDMD
jgi:PAS domain S-box-containing protein